MTIMTKATVWLTPAFMGAIIAPAWAHGASGGGGWSHHMMGWGWSHMLIGAVFMILFWGGLILLIALAVRWLGGDRTATMQPPAKEKSARELLDERFARGEIEHQEYQERKRLLSE